MPGLHSPVCSPVDLNFGLIDCVARLAGRGTVERSQILFVLDATRKALSFRRQRQGQWSLALQVADCWREFSLLLSLWPTKCPATVHRDALAHTLGAIYDHSGSLIELAGNLHSGPPVGGHWQSSRQTSITCACWQVEPF